MSMLEHLYPLAAQALGVTDSRWFTPLPLFWESIKKLGPDLSFVDVGTGRGDLPREAVEQGINMIGIDFRIDKENPLLREGWGEQWQYSATCWPLICRPCHSGFPREVLARARQCGAPLIYVGFSKNLPRDLGYLKPQLVVSRVGEERESMYLFK